MIQIAAAITCKMNEGDESNKLPLVLLFIINEMHLRIF